jgi:hypothetical protein
MTHALQQGTANHRRNYRRRQAAAYVREEHNVPCTESTLATKACRGGGPRFYLLGKIPIYNEEDLDSWVSDRLGAPVGSTSEARSLAARAAAPDGGNEDDANSQCSKATPSRAKGPHRHKVSRWPAKVGAEAAAQSPGSRSSRIDQRLRPTAL